MKNLRLARKNKDVNPKSWSDLYESMVIVKIRERYSVNQELAILRQRDTKPDEFEQYNAFVESVKAMVKADLAEPN